MSFRNVKDLGLGTLLVILLSVVGFAYYHSSTSATALVQVIEGSMPAQQRLMLITQLITDEQYGLTPSALEDAGPLDDVLLPRQAPRQRREQARLGALGVLEGIDRVLEELSALQQAVIGEQARTAMLALLEAVGLYRTAVDRYAKALERDEGVAASAELPAVLAGRRDVREQLVGLNEILTARIESASRETIQRNERNQRWFLWLALAGAVAAMVVSVAFSRALSVRIRGLVEGTERLSAGDLGFRFRVQGDDEFGQLSAAFNRMGEALQELVGNVHMAGIQVTGAATEIAATMKEQEASSTEQAATANEIAASTRQISSTSDALLGSMREVAKVAQDTAGLGAQSATGLARMETTMNQMADASREISERLTVLSEKAGTISTVVTTINKVADQTNLLSLNAAIEAEKAGEYGVGFSVVAKEIRRLADQTAVATWDIEQVVKEIQSAVSSGVMGMEKFTEEVRRGVEEVSTAGGQLGDIVEQVQDLAPHFETVHEGMQSQNQGAEQINLAIGQLSDTVTGTAESLLEAGRVVDQLNQAAARLRDAVATFKLSDQG
jgi:methyl-accepting chemotaxis protein WspA